mgnify:CR=1 FL=1
MLRAQVCCGNQNGEFKEMKKMIALFLSVLLALGMIPLSIVFAQSSADAVFTVEADKVQVNVGEEVTFSVYVETRTPFTGIQADINTPKGMTYVANSGKVPDGLKEQLKFTEASFTELTQRITLGNDIAYSATGKLKIMEFKCVAAEGSVNGFDVSIDEIDITDSNFESFGFAVVSANVKVRIPVIGVTLDRDTLTLNNGENNTAKLTATVDPDKATNKNLTWKSSNESIATVDGDGNVTALKKGTATITVATEDGNLSASCVVTVNCSHLNTTDVPAEDSTCIKHGHKAYTICNDCSEIIRGSNSELPLSDHIGGTATCVKKAVCDVCHKEYGDLAAHNYTEVVKADYLKTAATCGSKAVYYKSCAVCGAQNEETFETGDYDYTNHVGETYLKNQQEATCYNEGYTGDTYCRTCDREISKGQPISKNAHNPASVWTTDETDHWKECQTVGCGNIIDKAPHSGGEATCVNKAICSVCKVEYGTVNASNHKGTTYLKDQKEPSCYEEGYTGDTYCSDCNVKIKDGQSIAKSAHSPASVWTTDETNHWKKCQTVGCGNIIDKAPHSGGEATCVKKAICSVCNAEYGNLNASNHKHTELRDVKAATEQEKGYTGDTWCLDCNKKIAEGTEVDKLTHQPKLVEAKEATVTEQGNIQYYHCDNCDKYFADANGMKEISFEETVIKKLPPEIIEGNNAVVGKSEKKALSFRSNAAFADFIRVELDGKTLDENNYTKTEGSIIITLKDNFVSTLSVGEHTIGIVSESGTATAKFTVKVTGGSFESPNTGDNNNIVVWSLIAVLSLAGLGTSVVVSKKKRIG